MRAIKVQLHHEKETANTHRFSARDENAEIATLYVAKTAFDGQPPAMIEVEVTASE